MAITKVEYYVNGSKVGEKTSAPFNTFDYTFNGIGTNPVVTAKLFVDGVEVKTTEPLNLSVVEAPSYDPDYQAVLNYATSQSIPLPDDTQKELDNQFLIDYKATGAWDRDDVVLKFSGTADTSFKLIDWKRLVTVTPIGGLTWTTDGVSPTTGHINLGYNPSTYGGNYEQNDAGLMWVDNTGSYVTSSTWRFMYQIGSENTFYGGRNNFTYGNLNGSYPNNGRAYLPKVGLNAIYRTNSAQIVLHDSSPLTVGNASTAIPSGEVKIFQTASYQWNSNVQFITFGGNKNDIHSAIETVTNTL